MEVPFMGRPKLRAKNLPGHVVMRGAVPFTIQLVAPDPAAIVSPTGHVELAATCCPDFLRHRVFAHSLQLYFSYPLYNGFLL